MSNSTSYRRVAAYPSSPHKLRECVGKPNPGNLDEKTARQCQAGDLSHVNCDREIKLVRKGRVQQRLGKTTRQYVQWKHVAAGDVFKSEQDEDKSGDLQHPKSEHRHGIAHKKLKQGGKENGK